MNPESPVNPIFSEKKKGLEFCVKLKPKSSRNAVLEVIDGVLICAVNAPPVDGKANKALVKLLSEYFKVPKKAIVVSGGETSRNKRLLILQDFVDRIPH